MPEYTLRIRRYDPRAGEPPYWEEHRVDLEPKQSVLDAILKVKEEVDGSIGIRCSCQQAICGSCGVRMNGKPGLACNTHLDEAAARGHGTGWNPPEEGGALAPDGEGDGDRDGDAQRDGDGDGDVQRDGDGAGDAQQIIDVEPMGNMPVIRDLIVDMDAVHWKKIQRVTPWLINKQPIPEREYIVPHANMVDVTQTMACIQCGACVSDCLSMEVDPGFIGPAALAKAYRFVGDPRDADRKERLTDLSDDPNGIYDCTHCFNCIEACPKGVDPMSQIMRLRRIAGSDEHIVDTNNGHRHEAAFVTLVEQYGLLNEAELLPRSYGGNSWFGKFHPRAARELLSSLPTVIGGLTRGKVTPKLALLGHKIPKPDLTSIKRIYKKVEDKPERVELNLYVTGYEDEPEDAGAADAGGAGEGSGVAADAGAGAAGAGASAARAAEETTDGSAEQGQPEATGAAERQPPTEPSAPDASGGASAPVAEAGASTPATEGEQPSEGRTAPVAEGEQPGEGESARVAEGERSGEGQSTPVTQGERPAPETEDRQ
jgi:succinate dehydrogenase / fumarate reductase iron-sulfur subunit